MSVLSDIRERLQQTAVAVSAAVDLEMEVIDSRMVTLAGTGACGKNIGRDKKETDREMAALCTKTVEDGNTEYKVLDRMTVICTPLSTVKGKTWILALEAFTGEQRRHLSSKREEFSLFIEKMAELIAPDALAYAGNEAGQGAGGPADFIIGRSDRIMRAKEQAVTIAKSSSTVLITGESGTGKGLFAKAIHMGSVRKSMPFVTVNCGAIPENLLESELFGYEKGAFTGASEKGKPGKFELADGGTIFLDEIGDMPLHLQVKILHVLQNMTFDRVGGNKSIDVDVRVVAATNKNLEKLIEEGSFREDLYYRLSVIPLVIPPLRDRGSDIKLLMYYFLQKFNSDMGRNIKSFSPEVERLYRDHDWQGNVRELENAVEYGVNMASGSRIGMDAVPVRILRRTEEREKSADPSDTLAGQLRHYEKAIIASKLAECGGVKERAAKALGLSRATLYRKIAELDIR